MQPFVVRLITILDYSQIITRDLICKMQLMCHVPFRSFLQTQSHFSKCTLFYRRDVGRVFVLRSILISLGLLHRKGYILQGKYACSVTQMSLKISGGWVHNQILCDICLGPYSSNIFSVLNEFFECLFLWVSVEGSRDISNLNFFFV